jgi:hypothetical protein
MWQGIAYGQGKFIAITSNGYIFTSSNQIGSAWENLVALPTDGAMNYTWKSIKYFSELDIWIAYGEYGVMAYSYNGIDWVANRNTNASHIYNMAYGNGVIVAINLAGQFFTFSSDGINWSKSDNYFGTGQKLALAFGNEYWCIYELNSGLWYSKNLTAWVKNPNVLIESYILRNSLAYGEI